MMKKNIKILQHQAQQLHGRQIPTASAEEGNMEE